MFKFTLVNTPIRDSTTNAVVPPQEIEETQDDYRLDKDDFFESLAAFQPQQSKAKEDIYIKPDKDKNIQPADILQARQQLTSNDVKIEVPQRKDEQSPKFIKTHQGELSLSHKTLISATAEKETQTEMLVKQLDDGDKGFVAMIAYHMKGLSDNTKRALQTDIMVLIQKAHLK